MRQDVAQGAHGRCRSSDKDMSEHGSTCVHQYQGDVEGAGNAIFPVFVEISFEFCTTHQHN
eukprot:m.497138 g.497138  ORF g.497138 m.497138 type:complete len:61 (+) comp21813_c1_seq4:2301-2483(+)